MQDSVRYLEKSVLKLHSNNNSHFPDITKNQFLLTVCYYHVTTDKSTLCSCQNIKELLAQNRRDVWSSIDSNGIRNHNHLVLEYIAPDGLRSPSKVTWGATRDMLGLMITYIKINYKKQITKIIL